MRTLIAAVAAISFAALAIASPASAFEGGGRKPSEAPLITVGQHYTGALNNHRDDSNFDGSREIALWHLPLVTTRDVVIVDWHSVPFTKYPGDFPVCMTLVQGIDDFNWGSVFSSTWDNSFGCDDDGPVYELSGSGTARTKITVQEANSNSSYLEFSAWANETEPSRYETFPYDFTVEPILHYLGLAIRPVKRISANGVLRATANLATGLPAPDGLAFNLTVTWPDGGVASYAGVSSGGRVSFQLALPETAYGERATFVVTHPADGTYKETSSRLKVNVKEPEAGPPSPCAKAETHVRSLARQYRRLVRNSRRAHGATRRFLRRRAARTKLKLRAARLNAKAVCGT